MSALLTLCIHGHFLPAFAAANADAILTLQKRMEVEVLTDREAEIPLQQRAVKLAPETEYNQTLLALLRSAQGKYILLADAADRLQTSSILKAISLLEKQADAAAIAGGIRDFDRNFFTQLAPAGLLMRREAACRFLYATEYDVPVGWHSLAQLTAYGPVRAMRSALSKRRRSHDAARWRFDARDHFFNPSVPERYVGELYLYDTVTLDRYLSDAEKFLLFWPEHANMGAGERRALCFKKRAALYAEAARQAKEDGNATLSIHYALRSEMVLSEEPKNKWDAMRHAVRRLFKPKLEDSVLQQAVAEQLRLLTSLLGEKAVLYIEDAPELKALQVNLSGTPLEWVAREALLTKAAAADEVVVFRKRDDVRQRLENIAQGQPGRHFAYEDFRRLLVPA